MFVLKANIYGSLLPVDHIVEFEEYEASVGGAPLERVRVARVFFGGGLQTVVTVDLQDLHIVKADIHERLAAEMDSMI